MKLSRLVLAAGLGLALIGAAQAATIPGSYVVNGSPGGDPLGVFTLDTNGGNVQFTPSAPLKIRDIGLISIDFSISGAEGTGAGSPRLYFRIDNDQNGVQDPIDSAFGGRINMFFGDVPGLGLSGSTGNLNDPSRWKPNNGGGFLTPAEVEQAMDLYVMQIRLGNDGNHTVTYNNFSISAGPLPEPASLGLLAAGAGAMLLRRKRA
jgi:hypothetical protein